MAGIKKDHGFKNAVFQSVKFDEDYRITNIPEVTPLTMEYDHAPKRNHTLTEEQRN